MAVDLVGELDLGLVEVVRRDRIEAAVAEPLTKVVVDRVAITIARGLAQVHHRALEPLVGSVPEPEAGVIGKAFAAAALGDELVTESSGGCDAAVDSASALFAAGILVSDLEDTGWAAVDVALDTRATRSWTVLSHRDHLRGESKVARTAAASTPRVQIRPAEVELAATAVLF